MELPNPHRVEPGRDACSAVKLARAKAMGDGRPIFRRQIRRVRHWRKPQDVVTEAWQTGAEAFQPRSCSFVHRHPKTGRQFLFRNGFDPLVRELRNFACMRRQGEVLFEAVEHEDDMQAESLNPGGWLLTID
jgi:hypothetical protein